MLTTKQRTVALLDADSIIVKAVTSQQTETLGEMKDSCLNQIRKWTDLACADTCKVFISEGKNFRYDVYDGYKSNRKDLPPIPYRKEIKEWLMGEYPQDALVSDPKLEADDRLGYYATEDQDEEVRIIVSIDKDLEQVPTWVMNPDKWRFPALITPEHAFEQQMMQWLCGDSVDGYPGIKGFGPKKFEKWFNDDGRIFYLPVDILEDALETYETGGYTLTQAYQQYLCATIKHHHLPDYAKCLTVEELQASGGVLCTNRGREHNPLKDTIR
tara:strand:+ start:296 stop:1108 length:813 start_codon:yes stop_codon:yes gene_type:complete